MPPSVSKVRNYFRCGLAAFLAVWLSGIAFLICCRPMTAANSAEAFCPLAKMGGHCDKANDEQALSWNTERTDDCGVKGCAYLPIVFDKSRKIEKTQKHAVPASTVALANFAPPTASRILSSAAVSYDRIAYDNRILARHCILRI
jgi:hypothetical protein